MSNKINLKGQTLEQLKEFSCSLGEKEFRGRQLFKWIYASGVSDFASMTDMSKDLREKLEEISYISCLQMQEHHASPDRNTEKFLFRLGDGSLIESALMRYKEQAKKRCTVCISTQAGCAQGCAFCQSGRLGLKRNLSTAEIVDQVIQIQNHLNRSGERIHNVVIMGIGEPFNNYDNVIKAIHLINHSDGISIGIRRIAISTCGIPSTIRKFAHEDLGIRFAVSLHAPNDEIRSKIMPINRKFSIGELLEACRYYQEITGKRITFEYMLIKGLNDSPAQARALVNLLRGIHAMINLIPLNPVENFPYQRPERKDCEIFAKIIEEAGFKVALRNERGVDIDAACGQLRFQKVLEEQREKNSPPRKQRK